MNNTDKNHKYLYQKYKKKYLELKKKIGGAFLPEITPNSLYLPCEIYEYTKLLLISRRWYNLIEIIREELAGSNIGIIPFDDSLGPGYAQDYSIILKDLLGNNYSFKVNPNVLYPNELFTILKNCYNHSFDGNNLGGNYISSPNNVIFTLDDSDKVINCFGNSLISNNIVPLNCSFKTGGQRHIDEVMCFMPYGPGQFKIWIYYIREINFSEELIKNIRSLDENAIAEYNQYKEQAGTDPQRKKNFDRYVKMTFGYDKKNIIEVLNSGIDISLENIMEHLKNEQFQNKVLINHNIFGGNSQFRDIFVEFPLDIEIKGIKFNQKLKLEFNSRIINIPVFNRILIDNENYLFKKCFIPVGVDIDHEVNAKLQTEAPMIRSMFDNEQFSIINITTEQQNNIGQNFGAVGGNLHCLIKNIY